VGLDVQAASALCETRLTGYFAFGPVEVRPDCFKVRPVTLPFLILGEGDVRLDDFGEELGLCPWKDLESGSIAYLDVEVLVLSGDLHEPDVLDLVLAGICIVDRRIDCCDRLLL